MVAIVTGQGLGLERGSGFVLGSRGSLGDASFGRYGENVTVNAATGNLTINRTDEILIGRGPDSLLGRSYNSLGALNDDNGDNWRLNAQRRIASLTGTLNTAGSTVTRTDWDGSEVVHTWDAGLSAYVSKDGSGAYDTLTFAADVWTWTDGDSQASETYDALNGGRITATRDTDGNALTYTYTAGQLTRVTTAGGEYTELSWSGNNLTQMVTATTSPAATLTRVRYAYDASNRLSSVTTDLTPGDNSVADGKTIVTTYTYDGTSRRVASIGQTGGASLAIAYVLVGADYRVQTLTQTSAAGVTRVTSFAYDTANRVTTVTDALGQATRLYYDAAHQLTRIELPPAQAGAAAQNIHYGYNASGDVVSATDAGGNVVTYEYDARGNMTLQRDQAGNTVTRTYGARNELLTETRYAVPDPDGAGAGAPGDPRTSRFAYGATNRLRFAVSAEGEVTEYQYNAAGQQVASIAYRDNAYDVSALGTTATLSEATLAAWAAGIADRSTVARTDTAYDFRGNVATVTSYSAATTAGLGDTAKTYTVATYTYDQAGNLLTRQTSGVANTEVFTYDGLGRVLTSTDLNGAATSVVFNDASSQTVATLASGLVRTSTYNLAGELISYAESGSGLATATTAYKYDGLGRLRMLTDASGRTSHVLYDAVGRKVADIAADGSMTEYVYDAGNRLIRTIDYATRLGAPQLASLVDTNGNPANVTLASIRPNSLAPAASAVSTVVAYNSSNNPVVLNITGSATSVAVTSGPSNGSVTVSGTSITYTPNAGYSGADSFQYTATNASGTSAAATASITVNAQVTLPPVPTASASSQTVTAGTSNNAIALKLSGGAADSVTITTGPSNGTLSVNGASVTYTPNAGYTGSDSFQYRAVNVAGQSAIATVSLTVASASGTEFTPTYTASSTYPIAYTGLSTANGMRDGVFGSISSMHGTNNGATEFIQADLGSAQTVNHIRIASAPTSAPGGWGAAYTNGAVIEYSWDATNWFNAGTVSGVVDGSLSSFSLGVTARYVRLRMSSNWLGLGDFQVFSSATTEITSIAYSASSSYPISYTGLSGSGSGMRDGVFGSISSMHGTNSQTNAFIRADLGSVQNVGYIRIASAPTSAPGGWGATYTNGAAIEYSSDGTNWTGAGTVTGVVDGSYSTFNINANARYVRLRRASGYVGLGDFRVYSSSAPTVSAVSTAVKYNSTNNPVVLNIAGSATSVAVTSGPSNGTVSISGTTITYTPNAGYSGADSFQYTATNASGTSSAATASITVNAQVTPLPAPVAAASSQTVAANSSGNAIALSLSGGRASSVAIVSGPANGTLNVSGLSVTYTPSAGYTGPDSFTYTVTNASGTSAVASVALTVGATAGEDRNEWRVYDTANRLIEVIDGSGGATVFAYDGLSNLVSSTSYANAIAAGTVNGFKATPPTTLQLPTADAARDDVSRSFYDKDGRLIGVLDGAGYLSQIVYNERGEKVRASSYANLTTAGLRATGTFDQLLASVGTNSRDIHSRYFYDGRGLLRYSLDANLRPCEYVYDAAGQLLHKTEYAGSIGAAGSYTLAYVEAQIASTGLATNAANRTSWSVYDAAGRLAYAIDAEGAVTRFGYDALGQVVKQTRFAAVRATAADPSLATMDTWATGQAGNALNRVSRMVYDLAGRVAYGVDGEGYVTEYRYDDAGRTTLEVRYADVYTVTDTVTKASLAALIGAMPASAVQTSFAYDPAGRLSDSYDGLGIRTHLDYDALGRVVQRTVAYGTADAATVQFVYDAAGRIASQTAGYGTPEASTVGYTYDGMGNVLTMTDARGFVTTYGYDAMGNVLTVTRPLDATSSAVTTNTYDAFNNLISSQDAEGTVSYFAYDLLNRLTWQVDGEGHVTRTLYNATGEIATVTRYFNKATASGPGTAPTVAANAAEDAVTTFAYDRLGRVTQVTDALGAYEAYTLNAFGDRVTVRNKLGGTTTNLFDERGLLTSETLPMSSVRADGTTQATSVTNTFQYDSRGNRTRMVEASGLTEQRTTNYVYDKLDRIVQTTRDAIAVAGSGALGSAGSVVPTESIVYDRRGNVIETVDAAGARTLVYYDDLDRRIAQVNAVGTLSAWTYDGNGNVLTARVYGDAVALPAGAGGTPPAPVNASNYRETAYAYDRANRLVTTTVAALRTGQYAGSAYATSIGAVTVTNYYDRLGNLVQQTDGRGNDIFVFYDRLGRRVAQVDQEKYLTVWTLDADGNTTQETRHAGKVAIAVVADRPGQTATTVAALQTSAGSGAADRVTSFTYDLNGRRLTAQRTGVVAKAINADTGAWTDAPTTATVTYAYNALGEVTRKTEATGEWTDYTYDLMGRQTGLTSSSFTDHNGASVQRSTSNFYNGLSNLTRTVQNTSRVTTYGYDAVGNMTSMVDPNGVTHHYAYDIAGRLVRERRQRASSAGTLQSWEGQTTRYDALGRVIGTGMAIWSGSAWAAPVEENRVAYDAYGDAVGRGINGTGQESFSYDSGGRLWRSTAGDGTVRLYLYDAAGNRTLTVSSSGGSLPAGYSWSTLTIEQAVALLTNNGASTIGSIGVAGMIVTIDVHDKRGQNTQTREPRRETTAVGSSLSTITRGRTYNAFGEVTQETDARGNVTDFSYNTLGKVIQRQSPSVNWTDEYGTTASTRPTENYYYDLSGRLVGVADANGNLNKRALLSGTGYGDEPELVLKEFHADGGTFTNGYDVFNDLRKTTNEVGKVETFTYDNLGQMTHHYHESRPVGSVGNATGVTVQLVDRYEYDVAGNRIKHWITQSGSTISSIGSYVDTTDYDAQGRVIATSDMGGITASYTYVWSSSIATTGLGTFGGWTKTTVNAAGRTMTEKTDYFGRLVDKVDYGSRNFDYAFDLAGRLVQRTNSAGEDIDYTWYNTGRLASMVSTSASTGAGSTVTTSYKYDVDGNRTAEKYYATGTYTDWYTGAVIPYTITHQDATATWDAMNRMTGFSDTGTAAPASIAWKYDKAGNVRNMNAVHRTLDAQGNVSTTTTTQDYWYKYDPMNRFVLTKGQLSGGVISRGLNGLDIAYDAAGQRASATKTKFYSITEPTFGLTTYYWYEEKEIYTYTADGYLARVNVATGDTVFNFTPDPMTPPAASGTGTTRASYVRDAMGRVTTLSEYEADGTTVAYSRAATYNTKSEVTSDTVTVKRGTDVWAYNTTYDYRLEGATAGVYDGAYQGGVVTHQRTTVTKNGVTQPTTDTKNTFVWWDGALQSTTTYKPDISQGTTHTSTFYYNDSGFLQSVYIQDGRPRTVSFISDGNGLILQRDEADNQAGGDPRELHYYFNGIRVGDISNNGTSDVDYVASIGAHQASQGAGAFRYGSAYSTSYADFDQSYDPINGLSYQSTASRYTVQEGDTLEAIALRLWGDASFWYLIADANGLTGAEPLVAGQTLSIPNKVHNAHNTSDVYRVYDPNEAIGDTSPTAVAPAAKPKGNKCGIFGQILTLIIAVAVSYLIPPIGPATLGPILSPAVTAAAVSTVSQGIAVATGLQDKFSFKSVARAAITGGAGKGLGRFGVFGALGIAGTGPLALFAQGALINAVTQGIGVATGLQNKFSFAGVAAAGITRGVGGLMVQHGMFDLGAGDTVNNIANGIVSGMAAGIAGAAARSLITGTDFGDNIMAVLPDVIGNTIGGVLGQALDDAFGRDVTAAEMGEYLADRFARDAARARYVGGSQVVTTDNIGQVVVQAKRWSAATADFVEKVIGGIADGLGSASRRVGEARTANAQTQARYAEDFFRVAQQANRQYQLTTRALGGLQMVSGTGEFVGGVALGAAGVATSSVGLGLLAAAGGSALAFHGWDNARTGWGTLWSGEPQSTFTATLLESAGLTPLQASSAETVLAGFTAFGSVRLAQASFSAARSAAAETGQLRSNFSVYEVLSEQPISGSSRSAHRRSANLALYRELAADPDLAHMLDMELGADVLSHMRSGNGILNPPGTVWHHPVENPDVMRLLRSSEHSNPLLQPVMHPGRNRAGGFGAYFGDK
jgi:YD repeat-containing protein